MGKINKLLEQAKEHLDDGEIVRASVLGAYETKLMGTETTRSGILIATDRRVLFYAKKLGGFELESYPFGNISSFEHGKSMMGHHVTFHASGNRVFVKWLQPPADFAGFIGVVKDAMNTKHIQSAPAVAPPTTTASGQDVMAQLRQLGELRDAGIVTPEEFESKKAELHSRI